jgi:hypothetical protein
VKHLASPRFWRHYRELPESVRKLADKNFQLLKDDPYHPSLHFKRIDRVGRYGLAHTIERSVWMRAIQSSGFGSDRTPITTSLLNRCRLESLEASGGSVFLNLIRPGCFDSRRRVNSTVARRYVHTENFAASNHKN